MRTIKLLMAACLSLLFAISNAQNILTCELAKNFKRKSVFELKNEERNIVARIHQQRRDYIIKDNDDQYIIKKRGNRQYVFYDSVFTDTIATITNKSILLKNIADYSIKSGKSGWKIREGEDLELNVKYSTKRKVYTIEIRTPVYEENILNLLACYYAIRKCKDIIQMQGSYSSFVFFVSAGVIQ